MSTNSTKLILCVVLLLQSCAGSAPTPLVPDKTKPVIITGCEDALKRGDSNVDC